MHTASGLRPGSVLAVCTQRAGRVLRNRTNVPVRTNSQQQCNQDFDKAEIKRCLLNRYLAVWSKKGAIAGGFLAQSPEYHHFFFPGES